MAEKRDFFNTWPAISYHEFNLLRYHSLTDRIVEGLASFIGDTWYVRNKLSQLVCVHPLVLSLSNSLRSGEKMSPKEKFVYLFYQESNTNRVKVGISHDLIERQGVIKRTSGLNVSLAWSSHKMPVQKAKKIEELFKKTHKGRNQEGEWFELSLIDAIKSLKSIIELIDDDNNLFSLSP